MTQSIISLALIRHQALVRDLKMAFLQIGPGTHGLCCIEA